MLQRVRRPAAAIAGALLVAGCSSAPGSGPAPDAAPPPVRVSITQYSADQVNEVFAVNVANTGEETVRVEWLEVRAPGFSGAGPTDFGAGIGAGRAFDLRVPIGSPDCVDGAPDVPADRADDTTVVLGLAGRDAPVVLEPDEGADLVARLAADLCAIEAAIAAVPVEWSPRFPVRDGAMTGTLRVGPVSGTESVDLVEVLGTTSFDAGVAGLPLTVRPGGRTRVRVAIRPARCDPHAIGEGPEKFHFLLRLRLPGDRETLVPVVVPAPAQSGLLDHVLEVCGLG